MERPADSTSQVVSKCSRGSVPYMLICLESLSESGAPGSGKTAWGSRVPFASNRMVLPIRRAPCPS